MEVFLVVVVVVGVVVVVVVGEIGWDVFVIGKRLRFVGTVGGLTLAGDFDAEDDEVEIDRLVGMLTLVVAIVVGLGGMIGVVAEGLTMGSRLGDVGRVISSLIVVAGEPRTVKDGAEERRAKDERGDALLFGLLIVMNDDGVVLSDDETGLLMIKRVGFETIGVVDVVFVGNIGGVELPDDERISEIELVRSVGC